MRKILLVNTLFCVIAIRAAATPMPEPEYFEDRIVVTQEENIVRISVKTYSSPSGYEFYHIDFVWENGDRQTIYNYDGKGVKVFVDGEFMIIETNKIKAPGYTVLGVMLLNKRRYLEGYRNFKLDGKG
jgi:hypothetical protein